MTYFVLRAWTILFSVDVRIRLDGYAGLRSSTQRIRTSRTGRSSRRSVEELIHAFNLAGAFYFRRVSSMHRSAALVRLLRRNGWKADLIVGLQIFPMDSYSWVEVNNTVLNEKAAAIDAFQVMDRW